MDNKPPWTQDDKDRRLIMHHGHLAAMASSEELAKDIVTTMNGQAPNTRAHIVRLLSREANRIYNNQEKEYPSNVLDTLANNLADGKTENLTVKS